MLTRCKNAPRGVRAALWRLASHWWLFLADRYRVADHRVGCIAVHPRLDRDRGILLGVLFLFGMIDEFLVATVCSASGHPSSTCR
jgi:hypothetical protein